MHQVELMIKKIAAGNKQQTRVRQPIAPSGQM
jgi:hypothetical protein